MIVVPYPDQPSAEVRDPEIWRRFLANPRNPALVSFPRTGSHWLRMLMELQFQCPTLVRVFFYHDAKEYLCWHTHDDDLSFQRDRVIYLHRDPVDTVYSQLRYQGLDPFVDKHVTSCSGQYLAHLVKWLRHDATTRDKLILAYRDLERNPASALQRVADFLGRPWDPDRCQQTVNFVSKELVRDKTQHDDARVINPMLDYKAGRAAFRSQSGNRVREYFLSREPTLAEVFNPEPASP